jgi:hypothetical protein
MRPERPDFLPCMELAARRSATATGFPSHIACSRHMSRGCMPLRYPALRFPPVRPAPQEWLPKRRPIIRARRAQPCNTCTLDHRESLAPSWPAYHLQLHKTHTNTRPLCSQAIVSERRKTSASDDSS